MSFHLSIPLATAQFKDRTADHDVRKRAFLGLQFGESDTKLRRKDTVRAVGAGVEAHHSSLFCRNNYQFD